MMLQQSGARTSCEVDVVCLLQIVFIVHGRSISAKLLQSIKSLGIAACMDLRQIEVTR